MTLAIRCAQSLTERWCCLLAWTNSVPISRLRWAKRSRTIFTALSPIWWCCTIDSSPVAPYTWNAPSHLRSILFQFAVRRITTPGAYDTARPWPPSMP